MIIRALAQWALLLCARIACIAAGFVVVAIALPFRVPGVIGYRGQYTVEDKPGMGGWQFVWAEQEGARWYGFYLVHEWSITRALVVRLGFKVKPSHAGRDEPAKGMTFKVSPWKAI